MAYIYELLFPSSHTVIWIKYSIKGRCLDMTGFIMVLPEKASADGALSHHCIFFVEMN